MKVLVTGGAGFIGSHLVEALLKRKASVRVIDNFSTGKRRNIAHFIDKIELIQGDISNLEVVKRAVKDVEIIYHQAALPSVPRSIKNPISTNHANITGTLNLLWQAKEKKIKWFIYASSSSIYGNTPTLPQSEEMKAKPLSPYALTKYVGEEYCRLFYSLYGLKTICLRYFNVFGPNQDPVSPYAAVIPKFIKALLEDKPPIVFGDGTQSRDFTYVENVIQTNLLAIEAEKTALGRSYNISLGQRTSINELISTLNHILKKDIQPVYMFPRKGDIKHSLGDITLARRYLKYDPQIGLEQGLRMTVQSMKKYLRKE
ncbi:MAG: SDR family oxidoreductase [Candidatus Edwardsbacteria bacterium]